MDDVTGGQVVHHHGKTTAATSHNRWQSQGHAQLASMCLQVKDKALRSLTVADEFNSMYHLWVSIASCPLAHLMHVFTKVDNLIRFDWHQFINPYMQTNQMASDWSQTTEHT